MRQGSVSTILIVLFILFCACLFTHCGTTTGNALSAPGGAVAIVSMGFVSRDNVTLFAKDQSSDSLTMCPSRIRFKTDDSATADPDTDPANQALKGGEITIRQGSVDLAALPVSPAVYKRIEVDLTSACSGESIQYNKEGKPKKTSTETITLKFRGPFDLTTAQLSSVFLDLNALTQALDSDNSGNVKDDAEGANGQGKAKKDD